MRGLESTAEQNLANIQIVPASARLAYAFAIAVSASICTMGTIGGVLARLSRMKLKLFVGASNVFVSSLHPGKRQMRASTSLAAFYSTPCI